MNLPTIAEIERAHELLEEILQSDMAKLFPIGSGARMAHSHEVLDWVLTSNDKFQEWLVWVERQLREIELILKQCQGVQ